MGYLLEGKPVAERLRARIKSNAEELAAAGATPTLRLLRVGEREDDLAYERGILKNCGLVGVRCETVALAGDADDAALLGAIEDANRDSSVHGVMLFRPLPGGLDITKASRALSPEKDVDCMTPVNLARVLEGAPGGFAPCTPKAAVEMLKGHGIPLKGANVVVVGRSLVVGKPLSLLLLNEDATVTVCHSRTKGLPVLTWRADIVIAAIGKAEFMDESFFGPHSIVVDVGVNDAGGGKICGDVAFGRTLPHVKAISPPVGGVGAITTAILLSHVVDACKAQKRSAV
ncbi:MAG: bifunctional 5,10-methylenetetrahydrofolate dehydrogenase/5,10-methenyltetrahydrofolate cyclohydrolase [Clostridiales Family XIII bacterium]|nr:bifunctional 5,10-methylenetetrahydrofolate dehydrogenase/5,10-methenyltetrahydrofolate cyclohydrolase [Clostridiales Family XIII bacterium]